MKTKRCCDCKWYRDASHVESCIRTLKKRHYNFNAQTLVSDKYKGYIVMCRSERTEGRLQSFFDGECGIHGRYFEPQMTTGEKALNAL